MGRDLLQSHTEAMTKLRQEGRVTSCSVRPRCATGTVPAAAAPSTCSSPCLLGGSLVPVQHPLGSSSGAAGQRSRRARASPSLAGWPLLQLQALLGRFPLETRKSIYQRRLETSESGEVKLALNELTESGEGETRLEAGKASPVPVLPAAPAELNTH